VYNIGFWLQVLMNLIPIICVERQRHQIVYMLSALRTKNNDERGRFKEVQRMPRGNMYFSDLKARW
jgi:endonuclease V-like protein UPF0215 family